MTPDLSPVDSGSQPQPWYRLLSREQWFAYSAALLAWLFDCLDQQIFNLARDGAMEDILANKKLATEYGTYTTSVFLIGWAIGGLIFGALGDRYGRARMLTVTVLLYSVCTGLSSFAQTFFDFCAYRFITGLGVGGVFGLAVALVADSVPDRARAPMLGLLQSLAAAGNILAGLLGMGIGMAGAAGLLPFALKPWQTMFIIGALPAFLCVFFMGRLKEPEKWIKAKADSAKTGMKFGSYLHLLMHPTWRKHAWLGLILCSAGIVGLWGVGNFHPKIVGAIIEAKFAGQNLSAAALANEKAFWRSAGLLLQHVGAFAGMLCLTKVAHAKGRRIAFAVALLASFLSTVLVFQGLREFSQMFWMLPLMGFGQLSVFAVYAIYLPELFPISLRSTGTSFCYNFGRLVAASAPFTVGVITRRLGGDIEGFRTAGSWVSCVLLVGIAVLPFLPETKDQPLPE